MYTALKRLSERESGTFRCYSGLNGVRLSESFMEEGWFVTFVSTSWKKEVSKAFMGRVRGSIICVEENFKEQSVCADVSWISKFPDECEVLFARSVSKHYTSFECRVIDEANDGIQILILREPITKKTII